VSTASLVRGWHLEPALIPAPAVATECCFGNLLATDLAMAMAGQQRDHSSYFVRVAVEPEVITGYLRSYSYRRTCLTVVVGQAEWASRTHFPEVGQAE